MTVLLMLICAVVCAIFFKLMIKTYSGSLEEPNYDEKSQSAEHKFYGNIAFISGILALIFLITTFFMIIKVSTEHVIDREIEIYHEENHKIEENIDVVVKSFMEQEKNIFENLKPVEGSIFIANNIPELKSDTLVKKQIDSYIYNNGCIKMLKIKKLGILRAKWYLYFGK